MITPPANNDHNITGSVVINNDNPSKFDAIMSCSLNQKAQKISDPALKVLSVVGYFAGAILTAGLFFAGGYLVASIINKANNTPSILPTAIKQDGLELIQITEKDDLQKEIVTVNASISVKYYNKDQVLAIVKQYGMALEFASEDLKADREVVLAAVAQNGMALESASEDLKADREVVLAAVRQDGLALMLADENLMADKEVVLAAVMQNSYALQYAGAELQNDGQFILEVARLPDSVNLKKKLELQNQLDKDLTFLGTANFNNCTIDELLEIATIRSRYNYDSYPQGSCLKINKLIDLRVESSLVNNFHSDDLKNLATKADPIKVIKLVQTLKRSPGNKYNNSYNQIEIDAAARLFTKIDQAQGISQKNFADEELNIKRGGANYCCGSMSVAALLDRMGENKKTIEELLKEGVVRHQKLDPKQMVTLTTPKMLVDVNPEISQKYFLSEDKGLKRKISIDRYEQFLGTIPPGSSGLLIAHTAAIMYASNDDGSVEIFDSHGSSVPLIVGYTQPAYRASFVNVKNAAAYLSVHRNLDPDVHLQFHPLDLTTYHKTILAQQKASKLQEAHTRDFDSILKSLGVEIPF